MYLFKYSDETIQTQATQTQYDEFPSREEYKQWRKQRLSQIKVDRDEQVISGYYTVRVLIGNNNK